MSIGRAANREEPDNRTGHDKRVRDVDVRFHSDSDLLHMPDGATPDRRSG